MPTAPVESSAAPSATSFLLTPAQWDTVTVHRLCRCFDPVAGRFDAQGCVLAGFPAGAMNDQEKQALATQAQAMQASGQPIPPELAKKLKQPTWEAVTALLRDEKLRGFRVDIETDSTVQPDAAEEQKNRIELLTAITGFVEGIGPAVQSGAVPMDLAKEMLSFGVRAFKVSPQLEDALDALGGDDADGNEKGQEAQQQQQAQMQQQVQEAQAQIAEQQKAAEATIQQAKEAKHAADMQAQKMNYEQQMRDAMEAIAQREAAVVAHEAEIEVERITQDAIRTMQGVVEGFRSELGAMATKQAEAHEPSEPADPQADPMARMEEMHSMTLNAFQQMVERLTAPRKRTAVRGPDGRMTGIVEELA